MRIPSFILVVYITSMAMQPCEDMFATVLRDRPTEAQMANTKSEEQNDDCDECPPFCICSCCAHASTAPSIVTEFAFIRTGELTRDAAQKFESTLSVESLASIWQPPKA